MVISLPPQWCQQYYQQPAGPLPVGAKWVQTVGGFRSPAMWTLAPVDISEMPEITPEAVGQYIGQGALDQYYAALQEAASRGLIPQAAVGRFFPKAFQWSFTGCGIRMQRAGWWLTSSPLGIQLANLVTSSSTRFDQFVDVLIALDEAFFAAVIGDAYLGAGAASGAATPAESAAAPVVVDVPPPGVVDFGIDPVAVEIPPDPVGSADFSLDPPATDLGGSFDLAPSATDLGGAPSTDTPAPSPISPAPASSIGDLLGTVQQVAGVVGTVARIVNPPKPPARPPVTQPPGAAPVVAAPPSSRPATQPTPAASAPNLAKVLAAALPIVLIAFS